MKIAREGYPFAVAGLLLAGAAWYGAGRAGGSTVMTLLAGVLTVLAAFVLWFFRNPTPAQPADDALVVAPGQGKVIVVDRVDEPGFLGGAAHKISIFLSVFDVHVQRAPVSGVVEHVRYKPGKYLAAWADKASEDNEQSEVGIATPDGRVLVKQIAGLVARRIVTDPEPGDAIGRGERFGLIRFGSRVDLFLPASWEILCAVGDRVRVGSSVLARRVGAGEGADTAAAASAEAEPAAEARP